MTPIEAELLTVTFVDNAGIARAKTVPAGHLDKAATAGVGASTTFGGFTGLDLIGQRTGFEVPTGDMRVTADAEALVVDGAWAWAPGDLKGTDGGPWPACSRTFARRLAGRAAERGLDVQMAFETEWFAWHADGTPVHDQPAYGLEATRATGDVLLRLVRRLGRVGVDVDQVHPEYSPGQIEVSVGATGPVAAADRAVLVRDVVRTVHRELGQRVSLSPKPYLGSLGSGAHVHVSLWRDGHNLFGTGDGPHGLDAEAAAFLAGLLAELPALVAVGCATPVSYLRLGPGSWTGAYACWGLENREAPLRLIQGSQSARPASANVELKTVDASGNPYLVVGAMLAAGLAGIDADLTLPEECTIDPSTMSEAQRAAAGIAPLPGDLALATRALRGSTVLREAMGDVLHDALAGVREAENAAAEGLAAEALCERYRYRY